MFTMCSQIKVGYLKPMNDAVLQYDEYKMWN